MIVPTEIGVDRFKKAVSYIGSLLKAGVTDTGAGKVWTVAFKYSIGFPEQFELNKASQAGTEVELILNAPLMRRLAAGFLIFEPFADTPAEAGSSASKSTIFGDTL